MTSTASRSELDDDRWYFGDIDSHAASNILQSFGGQLGTFLVRKSSSSPGNFVLSFVSEEGPVDILICNFWQDAFYSLITDQAKIFHGLDTLIDYYIHNPISESSGLRLAQNCIGDVPPSEARMHGASNLLHRAVSQGNLTVVSELLKSGYRKIDAKNNIGQTALHIACKDGNEDLVRLLLQAKANSNVRDQEGITPLHLACRHDFPAIVDFLIREGEAKIQLRAPLSGEVALHEAAACGNVECVRMLLHHRAPAHPKASAYRTPAMLARANNHTECYSVIVNHLPTIPLVRLPEYYQGRVNREEAQRLLSTKGESGGQFLLRKSSNDRPGFVLSLMDSGQVYHFQIYKEGPMYYIDDGPYFRCLETLVDHYSRFCDGLPCRLVTPIAPDQPLDEEEFKEIYLQDINRNLPESDFPLTDFNGSNPDLLDFGLTENDAYVCAADLLNSPLSSLTLDQRSTSMSLVRSPTVSSLCEVSPAVLDSTGRLIQAVPGSAQSTLRADKSTEFLGSIEQKSLKVGTTLGVGEFGTVLKGVWSSPSGDQIDVAVKTLHDNGNANKSNFLREAKVMIDLNHPYIVKLLGICHGPPIAMVQELASMGSLLNFLLDYPSQIQPEFHFKLWASQVADGMNYLEKKHFVHRDLAARNLLLDSITCVKISDFGLSRALNANNDYYKATEGGRWPLKWYAPESIYYGQFTHLSDVWSYGVTLWEMYTFGDQPYGNLTGHEVAELLEKGERLPQPEACPDGTYNLMLRCWNFTPKNRPNFKDLVVIFRGSKDYVNIKPYVKNS